MSSLHRLAWLVLFMGVCSSGSGSELQLLPSSVRLDGALTFQRLLVEEQGTALDVFQGDRTSKATFSSLNPKVATVTNEGVVSPVGNGTTQVVATVNGKSVHANVSVENMDRAAYWSFSNHVLPVLTRAGCNSGACHGAAAGKNGFRLTLRGYAPEVDFDVLTRQALGRRIVRATPEQSLLLLKPTGALEHGGGVRLSPDTLEYRVLAEWIAMGARGPEEEEPKLQSLKVYPRLVRLTPGQTQQVLVQAVYANGHVEDVTRWSKFGSTDETVARVDDQGLVKVEGHGEAAVTVWFSSRVNRVTVTSPYDAKLAPEHFVKAARRNEIDEKNLAKLESLRIPPSPDASDAALLRRATLDATGLLPTPEQVEAYTQDSDPEKRRKLVERLLTSDAYVDYWTYQWSDLLLVSSNKLPAPAMWSFSRFVRESVRKNTPWDQFARSIVTAKGSTLTEGAANYFVLHREPIDLTENTSMAFLGMSLTCARCHNHPLEKWTQDQYYGVASLFARVQLKDGKIPGEVIVRAGSEGEVRHPRSGRAMAPQPLDGNALNADWRGDRREAFADWLAQPDNPYFARAVVNRVWKNFFGRGLIDPEDDLRATNPPSDEPLMEWLVADFLAHGYDVKHLMRTIMNSGVYGRSSVPLPENASDTKFLSHYPVKRLSAEVMLDAISQVLDVPTSFAGYPAGWRSIQLPDSKIPSPFLTAFGRPERLLTCSCERSSEPSLTQALHLANGDTINEKLRNKQNIITRQIAAKTSDDELIQRLFLSALARQPTESERNRIRGSLRQSVAGVEDRKEAEEARRQAIEDLYWAMLTGNEFLFNH